MEEEEHPFQHLLDEIKRLKQRVNVERSRNFRVRNHLEAMTGALIGARNAAEAAATQLWNTTAALSEIKEQHDKLLADLDKSKDLIV